MGISIPLFYVDIITYSYPKFDAGFVYLFYLKRRNDDNMHFYVLAYHNIENIHKFTLIYKRNHMLYDNHFSAQLSNICKQRNAHLYLFLYLNSFYRSDWACE